MKAEAAQASLPLPISRRGSISIAASRRNSPVLKLGHSPLLTVRPSYPASHHHRSSSHSLEDASRELTKSGATHSQTDTKRGGVHWSDVVDQSDKLPESASPVNAAAQLWVRYTQTVAPKNVFKEPKRRNHFDCGDDKQQYTKKISLPCNCACNYCVFSRQLGPVKIYFSSFKRPPPSKFYPQGGRHRAPSDAGNLRNEQTQSPAPKTMHAAEHRTELKLKQSGRNRYPLLRYSYGHGSYKNKSFLSSALEGEFYTAKRLDKVRNTSFCLDPFSSRGNYSHHVHYHRCATLAGFGQNETDADVSKGNYVTTRGLDMLRGPNSLYRERSWRYPPPSRLLPLPNREADEGHHRPKAKQTADRKKEILVKIT